MRELKIQSKDLLTMKIVPNYLNFVFNIVVKTKSNHKILNFVFNLSKTRNGTLGIRIIYKFCDIDIHSAISKIKNTYANCRSIIEIKKVTQNETAFSFKEVAKEEILKVLKNIDVKKSAGEDKLPLKLVKCAASYIYKSLTQIINQSLKTSTIPNNAKRAVVTPLDRFT